MKIVNMSKTTLLLKSNGFKYFLDSFNFFLNFLIQRGKQNKQKVSEIRFKSGNLYFRVPVIFIDAREATLKNTD
jgi:hypothetical protein